MEFVPKTHGNQTLVYHGYIFQILRWMQTAQSIESAAIISKKTKLIAKLLHYNGLRIVPRRAAPIYHNEAHWNRFHWSVPQYDNRKT